MKKVLVVEDNTVTSKMITDSLTQESYDVICASNGKEGLQLAISEHPDLIVLDIMMPVMDGITMLTELRKQKEGREIPVVVLSSMEDKTHIDAAEQQNVDLYMFKNSSDLQRLVDRINFLIKE